MNPLIVTDDGKTRRLYYCIELRLSENRYNGDCYRQLTATTRTTASSNIWAAAAWVAVPFDVATHHGLYVSTVCKQGTSVVTSYAPSCNVSKFKQNPLHIYSNVNNNEYQTLQQNMKVILSAPHTLAIWSEIYSCLLLSVMCACVSACLCVCVCVCVCSITYIQVHAQTRNVEC